MKAKPRDYRYAMYERAIVPKINKTSNDRGSIVKMARLKNKRQKSKKKGKSKEYFVWDFVEGRTIYPS